MLIPVTAIITTTSYNHSIVLVVYDINKKLVPAAMIAFALILIALSILVSIGESQQSGDS